MSYQEITDEQLKLGYYIFSNREKWKNWLRNFLIFLNICLWGYAIYQTTSWLMNRVNTENIIKSLTIRQVDSLGYFQMNKPEDLQIISSNVFNLGENRYDLVFKISNPNPDWLILIDYQIAYNGADLNGKVYQDFLLPGSEKYLLNTVFSPSLEGSDINLVIKSLQLKRLHNFEKQADILRKIIIKEAIFYPAESLGLDGIVEINRVNFTVENRSPYNFWQAGFFVILWSGTELYGINYVIVDNFLSDQKVDLEANWFNDLGSISKVEILPDINILDRSNLKDFSGVVTPDVRDYGIFRRSY